MLLNAPNEDIELILVDNGSSNDNEAYFKNIYPDVVYIRSDKNTGFAGGNNLGIRAAKGEYILLLNNDTEITENMIPVLLNEMELRPDIGLISPLILYYEDPKIIQYAGFTEMNYLTGRNRGIGNKEVDCGQYNLDSRETELLPWGSNDVQEKGS
ncbi:glycosyltransferase [Pedobacter panaciterrae]